MSTDVVPGGPNGTIGVWWAIMDPDTPVVLFSPEGSTKVSCLGGCIAEFTPGPARPEVFPDIGDVGVLFLGDDRGLSTVRAYYFSLAALAHSQTP